MTTLKDVVVAYATDVQQGSIVAGLPVRQACERFLRDLSERDGVDLEMRWEEAERAVAFVEKMPHVKGEWRKPGPAGFLKLEPWQKFFVANIAGWYFADGRRRFRLCFLEVARKNAKTTLAAALGLYFGFADGEPGAETYSAATTRDQARICFDTANEMVRGSFLRHHLNSFRHNIHDLETGSKFEPLSADASTLDGRSCSTGIVDELHAHKSPDVFNKIETSTAARRNPIILITTTAGFDRNTICWRLHSYALKVLEGSVEDDTVFAYIATLDQGDDWADESVWPKANPNLNVSVKIEDLRAKAAKAKAIPSEVQAMRRLHMNEWTESSSRWLPMDAWAECAVPVDRASLRGKTCFAGLDLAHSRDLTSLYLYFPETNEVLGFNWIDEESIVERTQRDRAPYVAWRDAGNIEMTPGSVTDFNYVKQRILEVCEEFGVRELAYDRFMASQLITDLMGEGLTCVPFGQGYVSMNPACAELERLVIGRTLKHGGDPVLNWAASNVVVQMDPAGNKKPSKEKSTERIDPIVALLMAIGRAVLHGDATPYYEEHGELLAL